MCYKQRIEFIIRQYQSSFSHKQITVSKTNTDVLMDLFGLTDDIVNKNKQYWNRELGMLWQKIVIEVFKTTLKYKPSKRYGDDEPYDLQFDNDFIDTKYRVGSGDSGTLKKFKTYGNFISKELNGTPVLLFLRTDNLDAAITACKKGGWTILQGSDSFNYIKDKTNIDLLDILVCRKFHYKIY